MKLKDSFYVLLSGLTFIGCNFDKYEYNTNLFDVIVITDWKKEKSIYDIELTFNKEKDTMVLGFQDFKLFQDTINQSILIEPIKKQEITHNFSMSLLINDSIKYDFQNIEIVKDTTYRAFTLSRRYYICNKIIANINGKKTENKVHIMLPYRLGKVKSK